MAAKIQHVGYIGLGIMGAAMAGNLLRAGYKLTVWNRTASKAGPLKAQGANVASSPAEVAAAGPQVICINVTDTADVEQVIFGDNGIIHGAKPGLILIDHSTISPLATKRFAHDLAKRDIDFLDAPVSGGDVGAQNGTLSIMVGGKEEIFDRCLPMLQAVGRSITYLGESGMGQVCKACNQVAVSCTLLGVCEAMALAQRNGFDLSHMIEVVNAGAGGSWQLAHLAPKVVKGDMAPGFMIDLILKDLGIVQELADASKLKLEATALARSYFQFVADQGGGSLGTQAIAQALEAKNQFSFAESKKP